MKVLIDTHVFLWWMVEAPQLTPRIREIVADGGNDVYLSAASAYELAYKAADGRLTLPDSPAAYVIDRMAVNGFEALPVDIGHALAAASLPRIHGDPFDRILVAQAQREGMPILTRDPIIARYGVETIA